MSEVGVYAVGMGNGCLIMVVSSVRPLCLWK